jgi:hypothetical protein
MGGDHGAARIAGDHAQRHALAQFSSATISGRMMATLFTPAAACWRHC